ncbi:SET domain-containing protein-lysine N-methyltransferase [Candidatus Woesearchaeota archaeon]|jgi:uncharacterized protein|nr:SET domain-containing protein-lysine N-methyltransferase [Candidatus Woesearchaeota archaeon]MBT3538010.1 SET domain-containing protein-lysine N-methyltransferase [Candidatus Woesearchaeota archaeon]MBT4698101.1 SET domain-containing protein-lysine N-methyltransferase [Candidatus Woesearchaeota archaeon]MBT4717085.1 SET domain-containing protein-lysine N-methyltransferase [Candidatus Woesearchaeota archaeon]MBT7105679.1 SET domain-containing protein-lysine N-methyltransferase [Candidatus Woe
MITATKSEYVTVKNSGVHNKGIFAKRDIPAETEVIEYIGERITKAQARKIFEGTLEASKKNSSNGSVYIFELNKRYDIDGNVSYNTARYINHSCEPNCEPINIRGHIWIVATKNIKKGEELSYDYGYCLDDYHEHPCRCGSTNCVGYIVSEDHRLELMNLLKKR